MGSNPTLSAIFYNRVPELHRIVVNAAGARRALDLSQLIVRMRSPVGLRVRPRRGRGADPRRRGDVAQLGEHLVRNEGVVGSNPIISTILVGQAQRNPNL